MNKRNFLKSLAAISVASNATLASEVPVKKEVIVKIPICIDFLEEWGKELENPDYVRKKVAWADLDLETGEWTVCGDDALPKRRLIGGQSCTSSDLMEPFELISKRHFMSAFTS